MRACNFCMRPETEYEFLIVQDRTGVHCAICDDCVTSCREIIAQAIEDRNGATNVRKMRGRKYSDKAHRPIVTLKPAEQRAHAYKSPKSAP